jgi:Kef-type K+ transport system membrane component KefB
MSVTELFLVAMIGIFTIPYLIWRGGRTEYFAPLVVVQIISGILLGPGVFGYFFPDTFQTIFDKPVMQALSGVAWWGVSLFVFLAGIELDIARVKDNKRESAITAGLALGTPLLFGSMAALALLGFPGWVVEKAQTWQFVLGIGMASAVTALPILILFMEKMDILRQPIGQRILRYASLDDIAIWSVLAIILMDWTRLTHQALFLIVYVGIAFGLRYLIPRLRDTDRLYVALIWLVTCACAADWAGLHFMVGAFLAGAVMDIKWFGQDEVDSLRKNVLMVMMPVFFLSTGLKTNWEMGGIIVVVTAILLFITQLLGKLSGIWAAGKILKWEPGESMLVGWLLQTKALIEIIFVNVLLDKGIITNQMFTVMLLMAILSTMATIPVVTPKLHRLKHLIQKS